MRQILLKKSFNDDPDKWGTSRPRPYEFQYLPVSHEVLRNGKPTSQLWIDTKFIIIK